MAAPDQNFTYYYANPDSNTNGFEAEGNYALTSPLSFNANGTFGIAKYEAGAAKDAVKDSGGNIINLAVAATPAAWVATAPHDTESIGLTYHDKGLDLGVSASASALAGTTSAAITRLFPTTRSG